MENTPTPTSGSKSPQTVVTLKKIDLKETSTIDRVKLVGTRDKVVLLYSIRGAELNGSTVTIHATTLAEPEKSASVMKIRTLLPARIAWDAQSKDGDSYEFVYELAGGALNSLAFASTTGKALDITTHYPFESFFHPHFIRSSSQKGAPAIAATVDKKKIVLFKQAGTAQEPTYHELAGGDDGLVGGENEPWVVIKHGQSGQTLFDVLPGRLGLVPSRSSKSGAAAQEIVFPDRVVYEFDAAPLADDVLVFATGKPSVLLLGSRRAHPIQLSAKERSWLGRLSSPSLYVDGMSVHIAGLLNPGAATAAVVYGSCPVADLVKR